MCISSFPSLHRYTLTLPLGQIRGVEQQDHMAGCKFNIFRNGQTVFIVSVPHSRGTLSPTASPALGKVSLPNS